VLDQGWQTPDSTTLIELKNARPCVSYQSQGRREAICINAVEIKK
jgi:hypothetical protein